MAILQDVTKLSREDLIKALVASQAAGQRKLSCKVSTKGALSVYGMGRWPVTLYAEQWDRLLAFADDIRTFAKANVNSLSVKAN